MTRFLRLGLSAIVVLVFAGSGLAQSATPNLALTPGVARPLSKATVCKTKWGKDARH